MQTQTIIPITEARARAERRRAMRADRERQREMQRIVDRYRGRVIRLRQRDGGAA